MTPFDLRFPAQISFGWDSRFRLGPALAERVPRSEPRRALLVCTPSLERNGAAPALRESAPDWDWQTVADIPHGPSLDVVDRIVDRARDTEASILVAVGGGSAIDAAKAAAAVVPTGETVRPFYDKEKELSAPGLPLIALPSTAGTGAEITSNAVLSHPASGRKQSLRSPVMVPTVALVDPALTLTAPPDLTAGCGLDALTQAIESYLSLRGHAASRPYARKAVVLLMGNLAAAVRDGADRNAREAVACGSLLSALAFSQSGLGAVHGLAHPIGLDFSLPHGRTCGILLPHILDWNLPACKDSLGTLARAVGLDTPGEFADAVRSLCSRVGIPPDFRSCRLDPETREHIVRNCRSGSMKATPRPLSDEQIRRLLTELFGTENG